MLQTLYKNDTGPYKYDGYIGFSFFVLLALSLGYYLIKIKKNLSFFKPFLFLSLLGFILSLGPALQLGGRVLKIPTIIPLPYALFYYIIPGFNGMRNSARWEMLFLLASAICIGIVIASMFEKKFKKWAIGITSGICFLILIEIPLPMPITRIPPIPKINYYIKSLPDDAAIVEMPIYTWYMSPYASQELYREYFSTADFKKRMNGFSGFSPLQWEKDMSLLLENFPNKKSLRFLKMQGVEYIIVHKNEYSHSVKNPLIVNGISLPKGSYIIKKLNKQADVTFIKQIDTDYIYKIK
jgi:hypothetical protein